MEAQIKEKREKLSNLYHIACANGIVKNKGEFASLLGIARPTFSYALTGSNPTVNVDNMIAKAERALEAAGIDISGINKAEVENTMQNVSGGQNIVGIPPKNFDHDERWFSLVSEKDKQIADLLRLSTSLTAQNQMLIEKLTK